MNIQMFSGISQMSWDIWFFMLKKELPSHLTPHRIGSAALKTFNLLTSHLYQLP